MAQHDPLANGHLNAMVGLLEGPENTHTIRYNRLLGYQRKDNCMFTLANALYTVNKYREHLDHTLVHRIEVLIVPHFSSHLTPTGEANFYPRLKGAHFGHGKIMHRFKHFKLPEDADDTALYYLAVYDLEGANRFAEKLMLHTSTEHFTGKNLDTYDTWMGIKMPKEQDVVVWMNVLAMKFHYGFPLNQVDHNCLEILRNHLLNALTKRPYWYSRNYGQSWLIAYFASRLALISNYTTGFEQILKDWVPRAKVKNALENCLKNNSLMLLGLPPTPTISAFPKRPYSMFQANLLAVYPLFYPISNFPLFKIDWYSPVLMHALLLEESVLRSSFEGERFKI